MAIDTEKAFDKILTLFHDLKNKHSQNRELYEKTAAAWWAAVPVPQVTVYLLLESGCFLLKTRIRRALSAAWLLLRARGSSWAIKRRFGGCSGLQKGGAERGAIATEYGASSGNDDSVLKRTEAVMQLSERKEEPCIVRCNWTIVMTCELHLDKLYKSLYEPSQ